MTDAIRQALIYKPASVTPVGDSAVLDSSVDSRFIDALNRPTLAQTFQDIVSGTASKDRIFPAGCNAPA